MKSTRITVSRFAGILLLAGCGQAPPPAPPPPQPAAVVVDTPVTAAPADTYLYNTAKTYAKEAPFVVRPFVAEDSGVWIGDAVCYGPYRSGQEPGKLGPSDTEILEDLAIIAARWRLVRVYDAGPVTRRIVELIHEHRFPIKILLGVWIANDEQFDYAKTGNRDQIEWAVELANAYPDIVAAVSVANETQVDWSFNKVKADRLIQCIRAVRNAVKQPVTTDDDFNFWNKPASRTMAGEVDFIATHIYAAWNGRQLEEAVKWTEEQVAAIKTLHPDREIVIGEIGWPTVFNASKKGPGEQGALIKGKIDDAAQKKFYDALFPWIRKNRITTFIFEVFDEPWKGGGEVSGPDEVEKHWGLYGLDRKPKPAAKGFGKLTSPPVKK